MISPSRKLWLVNGILWPDATAVHHAFRLTDKDSGRVLGGTLEIHTLELARYNVAESELRSASELDCWLFWFLHAHEYEPDVLADILPQPAIRQATGTLTRIAEMTEDKAMYDAREKAIRDRKWEIAAAKRQGRREGEIRMIRTLQGLLGAPVAEDQELNGLNLDQLQAITGELQEKMRSRMPS